MKVNSLLTKSFAAFEIDHQLGLSATVATLLCDRAEHCFSAAFFERAEAVPSEKLRRTASTRG